MQNIRKRGELMSEGLVNTVLWIIFIVVALTAVSFIVMRLFG